MMAKKKEPDKLARDAAAALAANMSYGKWKAMEDRPVAITKKEIVPKFGYGICKYCGKQFEKTSNLRRFYCDAICQRNAQLERDREKRREYNRAYGKRKRAERKANES